MKSRPVSISIIGWLLVVVGAISVVTSTISLNNPMAKELMSRNPIPVPVQYVMMYLGLLVTIICGIAILNGKNWGRLLYVVWCAIGSIIGLITSPMKIALLPGFIFFLVISFFLFRPRANEFFAKEEAHDVAESG